MTRIPLTRAHDRRHSRNVIILFRRAERFETRYEERVYCRSSHLRDCLEHAEVCNVYALSVCTRAVFYTLIAVLITTTAVAPRLPNGQWSPTCVLVCVICVAVTFFTILSVTLLSSSSSSVSCSTAIASTGHSYPLHRLYAFTSYSFCIYKMSI